MFMCGSLYLLYVLYRSFKYKILVKIFGYSTEYPWIEVGPPLCVYVWQTANNEIQFALASYIYEMYTWGQLHIAY
jgi:hypothetical protein